MPREWQRDGHPNPDPVTSNSFASNDRKHRYERSGAHICMSGCLHLKLTRLSENESLFGTLQSAYPDCGTAFRPADTFRSQLPSDHRMKPKLDVVQCALRITFSIESS